MTMTYPDIAATEAAMRHLLVSDDPAFAPLYGMMQYHLGWLHEDFTPRGALTGGKRLRPRICLLCCAAAGGDAGRAISAAAAIELLHNFTLIHDDIQDGSSHRHHQGTVWHIWGMPQAITVGDGMYAIAHEALLTLTETGVPAAAVVALAREFNATVLRICEGQYQDIGFENRWDITGEDYLQMIGGKTAALFAFSTRAGALIGGADAQRAGIYADLGTAIGLGFQLRDDLLGIWGAASVTGKPEADDIRRRKKSLPVILLHEGLNADDRAALEALYARDEIAPDGVATVIAQLDRASVRAACEALVTRFHADAVTLLDATGATGTARDTLAALIEAMAVREA